MRRTIESLSAGRTRLVGWVTLEQLGDAEGRAALPELVAVHGVGHVVIAPTVLDTAEVIDLVRLIEELDVRVTPCPAYSSSPARRSPPTSSARRRGSTSGASGCRAGERCVKRATDLAGAALIAVALAGAR